MRKLIYALLLSIPFIFTNCKNEGYVKIDSVSHFGTNCFQGEKLQVWVSVDTDDKASTSYKWNCDGGEFAEMPNGISMNQIVWIAPMQMGTFTITCEVECNGSKDIRSTEVVVDEYYNLDFEQTFDISYFKLDYVKSSSTTYDVQDDEENTITERWMKLTGNRANNYGEVSTFDEADPQRCPPITYSVDMRTDTYSSKSNPTYWSYRIKRPYANGLLVDKYIREIRLEMYLGYKSGAIKPSVVSEDGVNQSNMILWYEEYNARTGVSRWKLLDQKFVLDAYLENKNIITNMSMSIDENNHIIVKCKGNEVLSYDKIQEWFDLNPLVSSKLEIEDIVMGLYNTNNSVSVDNWKIELK